jgi:hypothetical protein
MSFFENLVRAIDAINSNAWAFLALCIGAFLSVHKMAIGDQIVMGAFALLKNVEPQKPTTDPDKVIK